MGRPLPTLSLHCTLYFLSLSLSSPLYSLSIILSSHSLFSLFPLLSLLSFSHTLFRTPISGNYVAMPNPPSENDYSIGLLIRYKDIEYVTCGDLDGDYASSSFGYTYNNIEKVCLCVCVSVCHLCLCLCAHVHVCAYVFLQFSSSLLSHLPLPGGSQSSW